MRFTFAFLLFVSFGIWNGNTSAQSKGEEYSFAAEAQSMELPSIQVVKKQVKPKLLQRFKQRISKKFIKLKGKGNRKTSPPSWRKKLQGLAIVALILSGLVILGAGLFAAVEIFAIPSAAALMGITLLLAMLGAIFTAIIAITTLLEGY